METNPSVEELLRQTAARRERLQQYRKEIQQGMPPSTTGTKENISSTDADNNMQSSKVFSEQVPEHLKKTFASLADQYRTVDEEDSQSESICSGNLSDQRSSTQKSKTTPRKYSRTSSNSTANNGNSPVSREKREHVTCGDSPRLHGTKLMKSDTTITTNFPSTSRSTPSTDPIELTLKERKAFFEKGCSAVSESRSSPNKRIDSDFRRGVFQEVAVRAQDPTFVKKNEFPGKLKQRSAEPVSPKKTLENPFVQSKKNLFSHPTMEPPKEVGTFTRNLQDKLLQQTEAWKHNELSRKIEEQKQEDMGILKKRWELMAEEEKNACERARLVEKVLEKQRSGATRLQTHDGPPPLPVPGTSSLHERQSKPVSVLPLPVKPVAVLKAPVVPAPLKIDAVARFQNPALKPTTGIPPPPPPPPIVSQKHPVPVNAHQVQLAAAISKQVKMKLPEEEGTDMSDDEEEEEFRVQYAYASTDGEDQEMEYEEYEKHFESHRHHEQVSSEESSTEEPPRRSGILKRKETDVLYVYEQSEDNQSISSVETASTGTAPISLSFYRKSQKESVTLKSPKPIVTRVETPSISAEESVEDKRDRFISLYQAKIDNLYALSSQQHTILIQTTAALNLCKSSPEFQGSVERAECERVLLWAAKRRDAYHGEINRLKSLISQLKQGNPVPDHGCYGKVDIHNIVLPTKEGFADYVRKETDMMHYFVVLGRCKDEVHISEMLNSVQHLETDGTFHFSSAMEFQDLESDFIISLEIYAVQARRETVSHEEKYHIKDSGKKKEKGFSLKKLLPHLKDGSASDVAPLTPSKQDIRASSFGCVGSCSLTLSNVHGNTFHLSKVPEYSAVDSTMSLRTMCGVSLESTEEGFLDVCGPTAWHRRYCLLKNDTILMWRYPEDQETQEPQVVSLRWIKGQAESLSSAQCARPHSFQMILAKPLSMSGIESREPGPHKYLFSADTKEERFIWCEKINKVLSQIRAWIPNEKEKSFSRR